MEYITDNIIIDKKIIKIGLKSICASNIGSVDIRKCQRYPITNNILLWFKILIFLVIVCNIWRQYIFIGDIYLLTIIPLLLYNINEFRKNYHELIIQYSGTSFGVKSLDMDFLIKLHNKIERAMSKGDESYTINIKKGLINEGIINIGNENTNEVIK